MNAAGSKVEALLVAFQSVIYHIRLRLYVSGFHTHRNVHSLPYARKVLSIIFVAQGIVISVHKSFYYTVNFHQLVCA